LKEYSSKNLRNIAIIGHGKCGKTTLAEACLFNAGAVKRLGKVDDGTATTDFDPEEIKRKLSISSALASCEWQGYKLNFIDTPGYPDFFGDVEGALLAADNALVVLSAPSGIEVETERAWKYASEIGLPRAVFINKMDREHADFDGVVAQLRMKFGPGVVPIQIPIGHAAAFQGVVDLLTMHTKIVTVKDDVVEGGIPEYLAAEVEEARQKLIEAVAEYNNELLTKYIEGEVITEVELAAALIDGIHSAKIFPVLCGSGYRNVGVMKMMNAMVEYMPVPYFKTSLGTDPDSGDLLERKTEDAFSGQIFKTLVDPFVGRLSFIKVLSGVLKSESYVYNVNIKKNERIGNIVTMQGKRQEHVNYINAGDICIVGKLQETNTGDTLCDKNSPILYEKIVYPKSMLTMAISPKNKGDEEKIGSALGKMKDEDPTICLGKNLETKDFLIHGIGEVQLEIIIEKMKRKYGVEACLHQPIVPYRETIKKKVKVEGKHKKQSGGHGQFGHVWLEIEPLELGAGNQFIESIFGGAVPRQYIPAVEKGAFETLQAGVLAGYPVVDVKVNLVDGSYHNVDSSELAFKVATAQAIKKGVMDAVPVLLEPIYQVVIEAPEYFTGDVIGSLNTKRAHISSTDVRDDGSGRICAEVPLAELNKYATHLRSLTQGRGTFNMKFSHYQELPVKLAELIILDYQQKKAQ